MFYLTRTMPIEIPLLSGTYLHESEMTGSCVHELADFEFLEPYPQDPIPRRSAKRSEPVPAGHGPTYRLRRHLRTRHIFVYIYSFITMITLHLRCNKKNINEFWWMRSDKNIIMFCSEPFWDKNR